MDQLISPRSLRNKISHISRGMRFGLSGKPPLKQVRRSASLENLVQGTGTPEIETEFLLADFLDMKAELPYSTVVEGLEEFLYQSELPPRVNAESSGAVCLR